MGFHVDPSALEVTEPRVTLRRIDPRDGQPIWDTQLAENTGISARITAERDVVVVTLSGRIEVVDASSGTHLWTRRGLGAGVDQLAVHRGRLVVVLGDGSVVAFDLRSGRGLWRADLAPWTVGRLRSVGSRLYAIVGTDDDRIRVGVFDLTDAPGTEPLWTRRSLSPVSETWDHEDLLVGRLDGYRLSGARLNDGRQVFEEVEAPAGARWVAGRFVVDESVEGVVLRMRRLSAYPASAPDTPTWTTAVVSSGDLATLEEGVEGAILVGTRGEYSLLDAATGQLIWRTEAPETDTQGRSCTVVGTDGSLLYQACHDFQSRVLVARTVVAADR